MYKAVDGSYKFSKKYRCHTTDCGKRVCESHSREMRVQNTGTVGLRFCVDCVDKMQPKAEDARNLYHWEDRPLANPPINNEECEHESNEEGKEFC